MKRRVFVLLCLFYLPNSAAGQGFELYDPFFLLDLNHDFLLSKEELRQLYPNVEADLFIQLDQDGDEHLSAQEFSVLISGFIFESDSEEDYELTLPDLPLIPAPNQAQAGIRPPQQPKAPDISGPTPPVVPFSAPGAL